MIHIDSFSGNAATLPKGRRSDGDLLAALAKHPRVSVWDLDSWLGPALNGLRRDGLIKFNEKAACYPWCHYDLTESGLARLAASESVIEHSNQISNQGGTGHANHD